MCSALRLDKYHNMLKNRKIFIPAVVITLLIVLPLTIFALQYRNEIRSRANEEKKVITILSPNEQSTISGTNVSVTANANFEVGHHGLTLYVDGIAIAEDESAPYIFTLDSTTLKNTAHTIQVKEIYEINPNEVVASLPRTITVQNGENDKVASAISAVEIDTVQDTYASISWETDDNTTSQILYKKVNEPTQTASTNSILTDEHSVSLTNLEPNTQYTYQIKSTDASGNTTLSDPESFTTAGESSSTVGEWQTIPNWSYPTVHVSLLYTGDLLLWSWNPAADKTKLWDPSTQTFSDVPISNNIFCAGHATLSDGRIVTAGGHISNNVGTKNINIFDPATKKWTAGPMMRDGRWYPNVSVLPNDKVVITTGDITTSAMANIPEVYDPRANSLTALTNISTKEIVGYSAQFPTIDEKVAIISNSTRNLQILDIAAKSWAYKNQSPINGGSSVQYRPGKILSTGGRASDGKSDYKAALVDLSQANPVWRTIAPMKFPRKYHNLVNLPDGKVLAVGGADTPSTNAALGALATELWDPETEAWTTTAPMSVRRLYHSTAVLLPDGRILASGGRNGNGENYTAEMYSPPYLFKGARPSISSMPSTLSMGSTISINTSDAANIQKVSILTLASQTHTHDMNQRFVPLEFGIRSNSLQVQIPNDPNVLPKGYYMVFIVNAQGVPSVAKIVKVTDEPAPTAVPTATKTPTPTPTIEPTRKPTTTPMPSANPTQSIPTPIVTSAPSSMPTATKSPLQTSLEIKVFLHGIGKSGDNSNQLSTGNLNPQRKNRTVEVTMYNLERKVEATVSANVIYNASSGNFQGSVIIPNVDTELYQFAIKSEGYLRESLQGAQIITRLGQNMLPNVTLVTGDSNNDNRLSVLDYNRLLDCFSDLNAAKNCTTDKKRTTDLNDDSYVNQIDYNVFLRELAVQAGD